MVMVEAFIAMPKPYPFIQPTIEIHIKSPAMVMKK